MYRSAFIFSLLCTIIATTLSRSIEHEIDRNIPNIPRIATISQEPPFFLDELGPGQSNAKGSLVILLPTTETQDEENTRSQKTKRCKTMPTDKSPVAHFEKEGEAISGPGQLEELPEESEFWRNTANFLNPGDSRYSRASRTSLAPDVEIMENDDFVCYCLGKDTRPSRKSPFAKERSKVDKLDIRRPASSRKGYKKGTHKAFPQKSSLLNQFYPGDYYSPDDYYLPDDYFSPDYYPINFYPHMQHTGQETVPYHPLIYSLENRLVKPYSNNAPTEVKIPLGPGIQTRDPMLGSPTVQEEDCSKREPTLGKTLSPFPPVKSVNIYPEDSEYTENTEVLTNPAYNVDESSNEDPAKSREDEEKDPQLAQEYSSYDYATESPDTEDSADPIRDGDKEEDLEYDESQPKIDSKVQEETVGDSSTDETVLLVYPEGYTTPAEDLINADIERVGAPRETTIQYEDTNNSEYEDSTVESTLMHSIIDAEGEEDPSHQSLSPFDSTLEGNEETVRLPKQRECTESTAGGDEDATTAFDPSNIDTDKFLDIARSEAGIEEENQSPYSEDVTVGNRKSVDCDLVEAKKDLQPSETSDSEKEVGIRKLKSAKRRYPKISKYRSKSLKAQSDVVKAPLENQEEPTEIADNDPLGMETTRDTNVAEDEIERDDPLVGMENTQLSQVPDTYDSSAEDDMAYLGKISMKNRESADNVQNLENSELFYIGDGVQLPLEVRKLDDGTYVLSISRKICERLLSKECPCCVPENGNVVRAVKRNLQAKDEDRADTMKGVKKIYKRESVSSNKRRKYDSADDSFQVLSMPVKSFAKRYNLSLNLGKVQTPLNFYEKEEIDGYSKEQVESEESGEEDNDDVDLLYNSSTDAISEDVEGRPPIAKDTWINNNAYQDDGATSYEYEMKTQRSLEKYRYQRNIEQNMNTRAEIVKNVLYWLKDMFLNIHPS